MQLGRGCHSAVFSIVRSTASRRNSRPSTGHRRHADRRISPLLDKLEFLALYRTAMTMNLFSTLYGIAILVVLLFLRVSARFRDLAERVSPRRFVQVIVFARRCC